MLWEGLGVLSRVNIKGMLFGLGCILVTMDIFTARGHGPWNALTSSSLHVGFWWICFIFSIINYKTKITYETDTEITWEFHGVLWMWFEGPSLSYLLLHITFSPLMSLNEAGSSHFWSIMVKSHGWVSILEPHSQFSLPPHASLCGIFFFFFF